MKTPLSLLARIFGLLSIAVLASFVTTRPGKRTYHNPDRSHTKQTLASSPAEHSVSAHWIDPANQTEEAIVAQIRQMYQEVQQLGLKNCATKKKKVYVSLNLSDPTIPKMETTHTVKICQLDKGYEVVSGSLSGWEWGEDFFIYKKNGKVFFVLITGGSAATEYERRYYCDGYETVVRQLDKESEQGMLAKTQSVKVSLPAGNRSVYRICSETFRGINNVLSGTR